MAKKFDVGAGIHSSLLVVNAANEASETTRVLSDGIRHTLIVPRLEIQNESPETAKRAVDLYTTAQVTGFEIFSREKPRYTTG